MPIKRTREGTLSDESRDTMKIYGNRPPEGQEINRSAQKKEVAELMSTINRMPEVRADRIKAIQESLISGVYSVDPRRIAEKILNEI